MQFTEIVIGLIMDHTHNPYLGRVLYRDPSRAQGCAAELQTGRASNVGPTASHPLCAQDHILYTTHNNH